MEGDRSGGIYCLLEVPEVKGAIVRLMSCNAPLKVSRLSTGLLFVGKKLYL